MKALLVLILFTLNAYSLDGRSPGSASNAPVYSEKYAVEEEAPPSEKVEFFADKTSMEQILSDPQFLKQFNTLTTSLNEQWPAITKDVRSRFSIELDRYNFSTVFGLQGNRVKILGSSVADIEMNIGNFGITADLYYRLELRPSFRAGKQMRKDIYVIGLKGSNKIAAGAEVRITFFREFDSKVDALSDWKPYGLNRIPRNAEDVLTKLNIDDGLRIEAMGNLEISDTFSKITSNTNLSAILGYELFQGLFMLDIYRYTADEVRARFMGTLNRGTVKSKIGLDWLSKNKVAKFLPRWFKELFEVSMNINISKSFNFFDEYPIETHVADYYFRFNSPLASQNSISSACNFQVKTGDEITDNRAVSAEDAFDELIKNVRTGKFISLFNPNLQEEKLSAAILKNASKAETLACADRQLPSYKRRVQHFFKGRMGSNIFSFDFGPKISHFFRNTTQSGHSEVHVASIEKGQDFSYYLLLNSTYRDEFEAVFGRWESEYKSEFDALYQSDKNKTVGPFLDFVKHIQYRDKSMSISNLNDLRETLNRSIPTNFTDRDKLLNLVPKTEQKDALISFVYSLSGQVVEQLSRVDRGYLYKQLESYLENHPERAQMGIPNPYGSSGEGGGGPSFNEYVLSMYNHIVRFTTLDLDSRERYISLRELVRNRVFTEYVFRELFPKLINNSAPHDIMSVSMSVMSKDIQLQEDRIGRNQYSSVYGAVLLLRSILNDRSLDLRLETSVTPEGDAVVTPVSFKGFKIY